MSTPHTRTATRGWSQVPNSFIENQWMFTPAERALALIVLRYGGVGIRSITISDSKWEALTGLKARQKKYAIAGLQKKCIRVDGRGERSRFAFDPDIWTKFVHSQERTPARTEGRAVEPKAGAKVHPECRDRGCALLAKECHERGLTPESPTQDAQLVAQTSADAKLHAGGSPGELVELKPVRQTGSSRVVAIRNAQPVAQVREAIELAWAKTLVVLQAIFPLVGALFLARLVERCRALFPDLTDVELASAVEVAWNLKRKTQRSEGLFLETVPLALRRARHIGGGERTGPPPVANGARTLLGNVSGVLRARGAPFDALAAACDSLAGKITEGGDLAAIEAEMEGIERGIIEAAASSLDPERRAAISTAADQHSKAWQGKMSAEQLKRLRDQFFERELLSSLQIPRVSLYYV